MGIFVVVAIASILLFVICCLAFSNLFPFVGINGAKSSWLLCKTSCKRLSRVVFFCLPATAFHSLFHLLDFFSVARSLSAGNSTAFVSCMDLIGTNGIQIRLKNVQSITHFRDELKCWNDIKRILIFTHDILLLFVIFFFCILSLASRFRSGCVLSHKRIFIVGIS